MYGHKIRELVATCGEIPARLRARLDGYLVRSTVAARAGASRPTPGDRAGDNGRADLRCFVHEMRNALTAAFLTFEIVAQERGPETRAVVTLRRNLQRIRVLAERGLPEVPARRRPRRTLTP
jgi:hypothetical protein